ncbi:lig_chan-Glu_bd domain-containing protein [Trichonephila inaurata madagascariensis]|uniref:Lig_chan-Glu_bd domain-containing protein n=1 Tax=Trichonephila inaurata madagascariensis TaxID=2747483 RepID=A0A8X7CIX7_9ARAC|nr:lig_chan-Glu_bd domain-containing protein [Trichonephila inaurata madagascariensis]
MTLHKSQGVTFYRTVYSYEKSHQQQLVYVALSGVTSLEGLFIVSPTEYHVFYHGHKNSAATAPLLAELECLTLNPLRKYQYTVKEADNRLYGMLREDGTWSGMIGELVNESVDMGVGDLSWTLDRSTAADLTSPVFPETVTFIYRAPGFYSRTWILFQDIDFRVCMSLSMS